MDFLERAHSESLKLLEEYGVQDAFQHFSLILIQKDGRQKLRRMKSVSGGMCKLGMVLMLLAFLVHEFVSHYPTWLDWVLVGMLPLGLCLIFCSLAYVKALSRKQMEAVYEKTLQHGKEAPLAVTIEEAATFQKFKILPEDAGYCTIGEAERCLIVEGIGYHYSVRAEDLLECRGVAAANGQASGVQIVFRVGSVQLGLVLSSNEGFGSILAQKRRSPGVELKERLLAWASSIPACPGA